MAAAKSAVDLAVTVDLDAAGIVVERRRYCRCVSVLLMTTMPPEPTTPLLTTLPLKTVWLTRISLKVPVILAETARCRWPCVPPNGTSSRISAVRISARPAATLIEADTVVESRLGFIQSSASVQCRSCATLGFHLLELWRRDRSRAKRRQIFRDFESISMVVACCRHNDVGAPSTLRARRSTDESSDGRVRGPDRPSARRRSAACRRLRGCGRVSSGCAGL